MNTEKVPFDVTVKVDLRNEEKFNKFISKLNSIAVKLNVPKLEVKKQYTITEYRVKIENKKKFIIERNYKVYSIKGSDPIINDYQFIGVLNFERGKPLPVVKEVPGQVVPATYFKTVPYCDHCDTSRFRKSVYILNNIKTGTFKQVGSSCLKDFLGHGPIDELIKFYSEFYNLDVFGQDDEGSQSFRPSDCRLDKEKVLEQVLKYIDYYGFLSNKKAIEFGKTSSSQDFNWLWNVKNGFITLRKEDFTEALKERFDIVFRKELTDSQKERIQVIKDKVKDKVNELNDDSSFNHNVKNLMNADYWLVTDIAFVCAMVAIYGTEKKEKVEVIKKESKWLGYEKERVTIKNVTIERLQEFYSDYGVSWMHCGFDENGNQIMFYNPHRLVDEKGEVIETLVGTIKKRNEFREIKQTVLTRVKVNK